MTIIMPPEWAAHERVWIGFPWDIREWPVGLDEAQAEIAAFANTVYDGGDGEAVSIITGSAEAASRAGTLVDSGINVQHHQIGDCWLRDTGCIITTDGVQREARNFSFNGWGGKYQMAGDQTIGRKLAEGADISVSDCNWILEGGAIDVDGDGLAVTTEQCLLNPNRNPDMSRSDIETALRRDLGIERLLWLGKGLAGDHTDGHVDNLARFVAPGHIAIPGAANADDPNAAAYNNATARATAFGLKVSAIPSPGQFMLDGKAAPASYLNFLVANNIVAVPAFGLPSDETACAAIDTLFPNRRSISLPSSALLQGGGSFHCISQQIPSI